MAVVSTVAERNLVKSNDEVVFHHLQTSHGRHYRNHTRCLSFASLSPESDRANVAMSAQKMEIFFRLVYLCSTLAYSEGQAWLCIAALATKMWKYSIILAYVSSTADGCLDLEK